MGKFLVIVESPAKARTISKFLSDDFIVESSVGHVRDLPERKSDVPEKYRSESWAKLGVNVDQDFEPIYIVNPDKKKKVKELKDLLKKCEILYLATDEDREGEAISWHLAEVLKPKVPTQRLVFHEITRKAIAESLGAPREIDQSLVRAQETRRILDRLFGFEVSALLWKKVRPKLSAGRVQSVALLILVDRERMRMRFRSAEYWDLSANFASREGNRERFEASLVSLDGQRLASGRDFDPDTGQLKAAQKGSAEKGVVLVDAARAARLREDLTKSAFAVSSVEKKPFTQKPPAPFTTSTLQQEGGRKHRFSTKQTMGLAQRLYENGFITYMRTDSTTLSNEAVNASRAAVLELYGDEYLPQSPRLYKTKVKNVQEAHEAIRPAGDQWRTPASVKGELGRDEWILYDMIWKRTVACQMADARGYRVTLKVEGGGAVFQTSGRVVEFPGFLRAYVEGSDDPGAELADKDRILPAVADGQPLDASDLEAREHHTQPPSRLTEAALVKELEANGIGRPSTWASVIDTILTRQYATKVSGALVPSFTAFAVTKLLQEHFPRLVDLGFTARMEDDLDTISRGESESVPYLRAFYFGNGNPGLHKQLQEKTAEIDPREVCTIPIGKDAEGLDVAVRVGRYGPFLSRGEQTAPIPDELLPDEMTIERAIELLETVKEGPKELGVDPETGRKVVVTSGRFGPYVQLVPAGEKEKPKNASLLAGMEPEGLDLGTALKLLELPRVIGQDEAAVDIVAHNGRYGPFIKRGADTRSLESSDNLLTLALPRALELLAQEKKRGRGRRNMEPLKVLGKAKELEGAEIKLMDGRFGPYVTDGETNASLPRGAKVEELTMQDAVDLIRARQAAGPPKKKKVVRKKAAKKKTTAKKTAAKKTAAKKTPAKKTAAKKTAAKKTPAKKKTAAKKKPAAKNG